MCYKPISNLLENKTIAFVIEPLEMCKTFDYQIRIANCLLFSSKQHLFWLALLNDIYKSFPHSNLLTFDDVMHNTGPVRLTNSVNRYFSKEEIKTIFLKQCNVLPYTYAGNLTFMCNSSKDIYLAKIWNDTSNWGESISKQKQVFKEFFTLILNSYQPDEQYNSLYCSLMKLAIVVLVLILLTILIKRFVFPNKFCKIKNK